MRRSALAVGKGADDASAAFDLRVETLDAVGGADARPVRFGEGEELGGGGKFASTHAIASGS